MARSMLSCGMFSALAASMAVRRRGLPARSPPPCLAATVISRITLVKAEAGDSAGQLILTTVDSLPLVTRWFRETFRLNAWTLQSDVTDRDGTITLYAEKNRRPVWVRIHANVGGPGTTYTVIGGIVSGDTVK